MLCTKYWQRLQCSASADPAHLALLQSAQDRMEVDMGHAPNLSPHANANYTLMPDWSMPYLGHTPQARITSMDRLQSPGDQVPFTLWQESGCMWLRQASSCCNLVYPHPVRIPLGSICFLHDACCFGTGLGCFNGSCPTTTGCQWFCQIEFWHQDCFLPIT